MSHELDRPPGDLFVGWGDVRSHRPVGIVGISRSCPVMPATAKLERGERSYVDKNIVLDHEGESGEAFRNQAEETEGTARLRG